MHILGDTNDSSWKLSLKLLGGGEVAWMRTTIAEWDSHSLGGSASNIGTHGTWSFKDAVSENV